VTIGTPYFFGFIGSPQHMMSQASIQPQTVSTETTSPQARQANLLPFVTAFFFVGVLFFAVAVFFIFVAKALPPLIIVYLPACHCESSEAILSFFRLPRWSLRPPRNDTSFKRFYQFLSNYKNLESIKKLEP
jgi:fatty acid desaturase